MSMRHAIKEDREAWNMFVTRIALHSAGFLQSWEWGMMQESYGRNVLRVVIEHEGTIVGIALLVCLPLSGRRSYFFSPRGPIVQNKNLLQKFFAAPIMHDLAKRHHAIFWRCEPRVLHDGNIPLHHVHDVEPATTLLLDLHHDTASLLAAMKQKTRYNIRLAEKKDVRVSFAAAQDRPNWQQLSEQWWSLLRETNARHRIRSHPEHYYATMMEVLGNAALLEVACAHHAGQLLAMHLLIRFGDTMTYLHGATTHHKKEFMAPYLLQWKSIQRGRDAGLRWYDFFGVSPAHAPQHPLAAVTQFKEGFGGRRISFPGTFEFSFSHPWYTMYKGAKMLKRLFP